MIEYREKIKEIESRISEEKLRKIKIAILSSYTINNILDPFKYKLYLSGFEPEIKIGGYNQHIQELTDPSSWLYEFKPDIVLIAINSRTYLEGIEFSIADKEKGEGNKIIDEKIDFIRNALDLFTLPSKIIITTLDKFDYSPFGFMDISMEEGLSALVERFNNGLKEIKLNKKDVELLDFERFCSLYGRKNLFDEKMFFLGKILFSPLGAEKISEELTDFTNSIFGNTKKVLVVDLDNTLWRGVVGEEGPLGIEVGEGPIGEIYKEIQQVILNYKKMGILLAISSKNNEADAKEAFESNKNMILKYSDFISKKINWLPKSENIRQMSEELNLGLESFVFLDDNPSEVLEVSTALPMVSTINFPKDIAKLPSVLKELPYFKSIKITKEDLERHAMYEQENKRTELKGNYSIEEYLRKLETSIFIKKDDLASLDRVTQLINKTNQFNLRTQRYTSEKVREMMENSDYHVFSLNVSDKFGELGLTGVAILKEDSSSYFIDSFLLSCRILSRKIENQFFFEIWKMLDKEKVILSEYIPSAKNEQVREFFESIGFTMITEEKGVKKYSKALKEFNTQNIAWISVKHE